MTMPVFVKIERYKESLKTLDKSRDQLEQARQLLEKLNDVRSKQEVEMHQLEEELVEIGSKIDELQEIFKHAQ